MTNSFLDELHVAGESGGEFLATYQALIKEDHWKYYLTVKSKLLLKICGIINKELAYLAVLEETSLSSDLSLGYTLKALTGKNHGVAIYLMLPSELFTHNHCNCNQCVPRFTLITVASFIIPLLFFLDRIVGFVGGAGVDQGQLQITRTPGHCPQWIFVPAEARRSKDQAYR